MNKRTSPPNGAQLLLPPPAAIKWRDETPFDNFETRQAYRAEEDERARLKAEVVAAAKKLRAFEEGQKHKAGDPSAPTFENPPLPPAALPAVASMRAQRDVERQNVRETIAMEKFNADAEAGRLARAWVANPVYPTSPLNGRSTKAQVTARRDALRAIIFPYRPMTVRQVFYQATVRGFIPKSEEGYRIVADDLAEMRRQGSLPYHWLADNTRMMRKPRTYRDPAEAARDTAAFYRKALWAYAEEYVEIWLEKDALTGVLFPITQEYDVPLMPARGFASLSFLNAAAEEIREAAVPTFIYHLGDYDPSGVAAGESIEATLRQLAPEAEIHFERIAVLPEQIEAWNLPTRPTKKTDSRAKAFGSAQSVELDAIRPDVLRELVRDLIEQHLPAEELEVLKAAEASERQFMDQWAAALAGSQPRTDLAD
jgi:hypothetical protein